MRETDTLQRFLFEHANIRGEIAHLDHSYRTIMHQHPYPPIVRKLLGEALVACILLTGSIKFEGEVGLQFHGDHRLPLLLAQCDHHLNIRAFAKYQEEQDEKVDYTRAFLNGKMVLVINQFNKSQSYQSVVPLRSMSMAENLSHYFAQSEQITSQVWLAVNEDSAAGMLLQLMPGQDTLQREQFWEYAIVLGQTLTEQELLTLDNPTILHRLYHETELRLFDARVIHFRCRCSPEKMKQVLQILGQEEIETLLKERGKVEVTCDFCNETYCFDPIDIAIIFQQPVVIEKQKRKRKKKE